MDIESSEKAVSNSSAGVKMVRHAHCNSVQNLVFGNGPLGVPGRICCICSILVMLVTPSLSEIHR